MLEKLSQNLHYKQSVVINIDNPCIYRGFILNELVNIIRKEFEYNSKFKKTEK